MVQNLGDGASSRKRHFQEIAHSLLARVFCMSPSYFEHSPLCFYMLLYRKKNCIVAHNVVPQGPARARNLAWIVQIGFGLDIRIVSGINSRSSRGIYVAFNLNSRIGSRSACDGASAFHLAGCRQARSANHGLVCNSKYDDGHDRPHDETPRYFPDFGPSLEITSKRTIIRVRL
jgi:hypothetical protein